MGTLWGAATVKLVGAGGDDPRFALDVSALVGEHDVATMALTRDATGYQSRQVSVRRQRIMGPEDVRALKRGTAILLASGARPALLRLDPWFSQPAAPVLAAATAAAVAQISDAAEPERLVGDLATDGLRLPTPPVPPVLDRPLGAAGRPHLWTGRPGAGGTDGEAGGGPGAFDRAARPSMPRFRGSGRRP
jgi:hypothetical protein